MCFRKSRKKLNFLVLFFTIVLLSVVSLSFGTNRLSANPNNYLQIQNGINSSNNSAKSRLLNIQKETKQSDFLTDILGFRRYELNVIDSEMFETIIASPSIEQVFVQFSAVWQPFSLTVKGSSFTQNSVVRWNGQDRPTTFISSTELTANLPGSDAIPGSNNTITVFDPVGGVSNAAGYSILPCSFTYSGQSANFSNPISASGGLYTLFYRTQRGCIPSATTNVPWITDILGGSSGTSSTLSFKVQPNTDDARSGRILAPDGGSVIVNQEAACKYTFRLPFGTTIDTTASSFPNNYFFPVNARSGCSWTATTNDSWINIIAGSPGNGSGTVTFTPQANTGNARTGTITINFEGGSLTVTVNQASGCTYSVSPPQSPVSHSGITGTINVTTVSGCTWSAQSSVSWITINSGSSSTGNGTVQYTVSPNVGPNRTGTITVAGQNFTIEQGKNCHYSTPDQNGAHFNIPANGGSFSFTLSRPLVCNPLTMTIHGSASLTGGSSVTTDTTITETFIFSVPPNTSGLARTGGAEWSGLATQYPQQTVRFAVNFSQPTQCILNLASTSQNYNASGGTDNLNIREVGNCGIQTPFTASSNAAWITIANPSGNAPGNLAFSLAANTGPARSGAITVSSEDQNLTFTVNQASGCIYALASTNVDIATSGGNGSFNINTEAGCTWTATTNSVWINLTSPSGNGSGAVNFSVHPNNGPARSGTITVGGQTFTVNQSNGCSFALSSSSDAINASGGNANVNVTTEAGCAWTAQSNNSWITITSASSSLGNGTVNFSVAANTGNARSGTITIAGKTFTVNQATGCLFSLSATSVNFSPLGGNASVNVTTGAGCTWTAASNVSWINVANGANRTGNGTVNFAVTANTEPQRTGTLTIAGQTYTVTQATGCAYSLSSNEINISANGGDAGFSVSTSEGCVWTAVSNTEWITINSGSASGNGSVAFLVTSNTSAARTGTITIGGKTFTVNQAAATAARFDFDGDGRADISVFRPENGAWYLLNSQSGFAGVGFGIQADKLAAADYDGDRKSDIAVWRENPDDAGKAYYYILRSSDNVVQAFQFGATGDVPLSGDFDGDGKADLAVYRKGANNSQSHFFYRPSAQTGVNYITYAFGLGEDKPVVEDFDGDGKTDIAVYRPSNGVWYIQKSRDGFYATQFGVVTDKPVPADYDGDGKADVAVFRVENGVWYLQRSRDGFAGFAFGIGTDKPVAADYDGDGKADIAVFRNGIWYLQRSTAGFSGVQFGILTDKPVPNAFVQ